MKIIYKLKKEKNSIRQIKYILKQKYELDILIKDIRRISLMITNPKLENTYEENFIYWCKDEMMKLGFINLNVKYISNKQNGIYLLRSALKINIKLLKEKIYDKPFGMNRKYYRLHKGDVQRL